MHMFRHKDEAEEPERMSLIRSVDAAGKLDSKVVASQQGQPMEAGKRQLMGVPRFVEMPNALAMGFGKRHVLDTMLSTTGGKPPVAPGGLIVTSGPVSYRQHSWPFAHGQRASRSGKREGSPSSCPSCVPARAPRRLDAF